MLSDSQLNEPLFSDNTYTLPFEMDQPVIYDAMPDPFDNSLTIKIDNATSGRFIYSRFYVTRVVMIPCIVLMIFFSVLLIWSILKNLKGVLKLYISVIFFAIAVIFFAVQIIVNLARNQVCCKYFNQILEIIVGQ